MKPWLIFRYHYYVREVWGPFVSEREARGYLTSLLEKDPTLTAREFALKEIDHFQGKWEKEKDNA